jgi:hypothetical protein
MTKVTDALRNFANALKTHRTQVLKNSYCKARDFVVHTHEVRSLPSVGYQVHAYYAHTFT